MHKISLNCTHLILACKSNKCLLKQIIRDFFWILRILFTNISIINTIPFYIFIFSKIFLTFKYCGNSHIPFSQYITFKGPIKTSLIGMTSNLSVGLYAFGKCNLLLLTSTAISPFWQLLCSLINWLPQLEIFFFFFDVKIWCFYVFKNTSKPLPN